jgi:hypothetical protein
VHFRIALVLQVLIDGVPDKIAAGVCLFHGGVFLSAKMLFSLYRKNRGESRKIYPEYPRKGLFFTRKMLYNTP